MIQNPFILQPTEIVAKLNSDIKNGLTTDQAKEYLHIYGDNQVPEHRPKKRRYILLDQFADAIIYILIVAAALAFFFRNWLEGTAILVVILISVAIGFFMELQAVRSLEALRKMGQAVTTVIRSGIRMKVKASALVPGDLILLNTGDIISADARLVEVDNFKVKESALTGESIAVSKKIAVIPLLGTPITHQHNMVFKGTLVMNGTATAIITATGKHTQLGNIQQLGIDAKEHAAPLEKKLNELSKWLIWLTVLLALLIVFIGYMRGENLIDMIETGVALAVAAIPEGLPIVATVALAKGMIRLSKKQVIIKQMEAVETLGATDIICTDKTGTLTEDQLKVHSLLFASDFEIKSYHIVGDKLKPDCGMPALHTLLQASILCNNVKTITKELSGDALELALLDFAKQMKYDLELVRKSNPEIVELPFNPKRKLMATAHKNGDEYLVFVKGAFEIVSDLCVTIVNMSQINTYDKKEDWSNQVDVLASSGLRTLAFAYKKTKEKPRLDNILKDLTFVGVIGCKDPARTDVKHIIDVYKKAGIKVVMVTGDHPKTAKSIAEEIGLLTDNAPNYKIFSGKDLHTLRDMDQSNIRQLSEVIVFARTTPEQKLDLIHFYQKNNHVVGMIGDGINDVPALRQADIGIAMGKRGTGAAREAADVILRNDKFTAIELAIHQGRVVFQNIRQFVVYLLSCNLAEILSVGIAALLSLPSPLLPLQILFLNLVTDTFPALALGIGKGQKDIMELPPRNPKEPIVSKDDWKRTVLYGSTITMAVLGIVVYAHFVLKLSPITINNMAFFTLVFAQLLNVFNIPRSSRFYHRNEVTSNIWIWGALILSMAITFIAYLLPKVAQTLSLERLTIYQMGTSFFFALGSLVLAQVLVLLLNIPKKNK